MSQTHILSSSIAVSPLETENDEPKWIRLLDSSGIQVLGNIPTDYEDSFCLETFGDLIKAHHKHILPPSSPLTQTGPATTKSKPSASSSLLKPPTSKATNLKESASLTIPSTPKHKCFIFARVQTWDPRQPSKAYYSYYNAFYLNKILFNTQVYLGKKLIHRMHVLNPLTNSDIIGDVLYFMVQAKPVSESASSSAIPLPKPNNDATNNPSHSITPIVSPPTLQITSSSPTSGNASPQKPQLPRLLIPSTASSHPSSALTKTHDVPPPSPSLLRAEKEPAPQWTLASPTVTLITDHEYQWLSPTHLGSTPAQPNPATLLSSNPPKTSAMTQRARRLSQTAKHVARRFSALPVSTGNPASVPPSTSGSSSSSHPPVSARRMSAQVPVPLVSTTAAARRGSTSPVPAIASMVRVPVSGGGGQPPPAGGVTTIELQWPSTPVYLNAPKRAVVPHGTVTQFSEPVATVGTSTVRVPAVVVKERTDTEQGGYEAQVFATDTDFLERSEVRRVFREHAVGEDECTLFELPEYTGSPEDEDLGTPVVVLVDEGTLCDVCYPDEDRLRGRPWVRVAHQVKCICICLALSVGVIMLVVSLLRGRAGA